MGDASLSVAILGASGYGGAELVRLLSAHPAVGLAYLGAGEQAGRRLAEVHPHLAPVDAPLEPIDAVAVARRAQLAFLSLPSGVSADLAPALLESGVRVIDLGGDFRLRADAYPEWYGFEHPAPAWLDKAAYGLSELFAPAIAGAELIANPGCYPTPAVLGLAPLLAAGLIEPGRIQVDGKSGISGAGRASGAAASFVAAEESVRPYRAPGHQHTPEIERAVELATGLAPAVTFVPHLVPAVRGVEVTTFAPLARDATTEELTACLAAAYEGHRFVRVLPPGGMVDTKRTRGSNLVELQAAADPRTGTAILAGALDNLVKGAAGQAIQNLNLQLGIDEGTALPEVPLGP